jgi:hypothetical protein
VCALVELATVAARSSVDSVDVGCLCVQYPYNVDISLDMWTLWMGMEPGMEPARAPNPTTTNLQVRLKRDKLRTEPADRVRNMLALSVDL